MPPAIITVLRNVYPRSPFFSTDSGFLGTCLFPNIVMNDTGGSQLRPTATMAHADEQ